MTDTPRPDAASPERLSHADVAADLERRLLPDARAVAQALTLLDEQPWADLAYIAMCLPGKTEGVWTTGQSVETVPDAVVLAARRAAGSDASRPTARAARDTCWEMAVRHLAGRPGVVAYAVVDRRSRHGVPPVFEDPLPPVALDDHARADAEPPATAG